MSDVLTITDLETAKKHDTFHSEVITGKAGGLASGADIDSATNAVTGQVQTALPKVMRDVGFKPASFNFVTGGALGVTDADKCIYNPAPAGDDNWYSWGGVLPHTVAPGADPTAVGSGYVPRTDVLLRGQLAWAVAEYHVSNSLTLTAILTMTTGPVTIYAPVGRWPGCDGSLWRDGITLLGAQMPHISSDGGRLEHGTVFTGALSIIKKSSGCIMNCGFDCGPDFVSGGGAPDNGLMITNTLESEQESTQPSIKNWLIDNVSGLCMPASETHKFHALLLEGMESSHIGHVVGYNGIASVVIKNKNSTCGTLVGYFGDPYTVTIKSNKYAPVENVTVDSILSFEGGGVTIVSDDPTPVGAELKNVAIGNVVVRGGKTGFQGASTDAQPIDGLTVGNLIVTGASVGAGGFRNGAKNVKIGQHYIQGCANGLAITDNADVNIGDGSSIGNGQFGYIVSSPNAKAGRIHSELNGVNGTYITTDSFRVNSYGGSNHHMKAPLTLEITGLLSGISLSGTVDQQPTYRTFAGGRVAIEQGTTAMAVTVGGQIGLLPDGIRPLYEQKGHITFYDGANFDTMPVSIATSGVILSLRSSSAATWNLYFSGLQFSYQ